MIGHILLVSSKSNHDAPDQYTETQIQLSEVHKDESYSKYMVKALAAANTNGSDESVLPILRPKITVTNLNSSFPSSNVQALQESNHQIVFTSKYELSSSGYFTSSVIKHHDRVHLSYNLSSKNKQYIPTPKSDTIDNSFIPPAPCNKALMPFLSNKEIISCSQQQSLVDTVTAKNQPPSIPMVIYPAVYQIEMKQLIVVSSSFTPSKVAAVPSYQDDDEYATLDRQCITEIGKIKWIFGKELFAVKDDVTELFSECADESEVNNLQMKPTNLNSTMSCSVTYLQKPLMIKHVECGIGMDSRKKREFKKE